MIHHRIGSRPTKAIRYVNICFHFLVINMCLLCFSFNYNINIITFSIDSNLLANFFKLFLSENCYVSMNQSAFIGIQYTEINNPSINAIGNFATIISSVPSLRSIPTFPNQIAPSIEYH